MLCVRPNDEFYSLVMAHERYDKRRFASELESLLGLVVGLSITSKREVGRPRKRTVSAINRTSRILMNFFLSESSTGSLRRGNRRS
jgi:hypothetical protein